MQIDLIASPVSGAAAITMTSREIAELTGKNHADVMRDIRNMVDQLTKAELLSCAKSTTYTGKDGRQYPQYELDKDTTLTLLLGYDPVARMKVVKRWQELEAKAAAPTASVVQDPEVARLVAMRDGGLLSQLACEIAAFRLLGLIHPGEARASDPAAVAPVAPETQSKEKLPYFLHVEYWQTKRGRRVKPRPKFHGKPTLVKLTEAGRELLRVDTNGLVVRTAGELGGCVVGGYFEVRRALYEYDIDTITGGVTVFGAAFSAGRQSGGEQLWQAVKLLRHISGVK